MMRRWISDLGYRVRTLLSRREAEEGLRQELEFHLEMEAGKLTEAGLAPEEARRQARIRFGGQERFREATRESWGLVWVTDLAGDMRFAVRQLRRRPGFTLLAASTLALGVGGTVALFSAVNGIMFRPLPVAEEEALVTFWSDYHWRGIEYDFVRERAQAFTDVAAYTDGASTLRSESGARLIPYSLGSANLFDLGSANLFDVLGVAPLLGRTFVEGEDRRGSEPVLLLSHGAWVREFGKDTEIRGRTVELGGTARRVIGVMPEGFWYPSPESEAWVPLVLDPAARDYANNGRLVLTGRVRDGVTDVQVQSDLDRIASALGDTWEYPSAWDKARAPYVVPTRAFLVGDVSAPLVLLLGAVVLVLIMACANVAALLVTRASDRSGEMAVRASLGAGQTRLARQVLTESVLLGLLSGALGLLLAVVAFDLLVGSLSLPRELGAALSLDWTALAAGMSLAVVTGAAVSLAPLHSLLRGEVSRAASASRSGGAGTGRRGRLQDALVVAEVLTAVVLTTGTALLVRTVGELRSVDPGLDPVGVLTVEALLPNRQDSGVDNAQFHERFLDRVRALSGVESAGLLTRVPIRDGGWQGSVSMSGRPELTGEQTPNAYFRPASPGALETLGVELLEGRWFTDADDETQPSVAIVNETFARTMVPESGAVGSIIDSHFGLGPSIQVVGVVRNVAVVDLVGGVPMAVYYPWKQAASGSAVSIAVLRTALDPSELVRPVHEIIHELDPRAAVSRTASMQDVLDAAMSEPLRLRFFLGLFSALGLVLGAVGVYGIVSSSVQRRRTEYGVRMALGAGRGRLIGEVVRVGMAPVVIGVLGGAGVAFFASRALGGFLFGVEPTDPTSLVSASAILLLAGAFAALVPAVRAAATDPSDALRAE